MKHELDALGRPYKFHLFSGGVVLMEFLSEQPGCRFTCRIVGGKYDGSSVTRMEEKNWYSTASPEKLQGRSAAELFGAGLLKMDPMPGVLSHVLVAEITGSSPNGKKLNFSEVHIEPASDYLKITGAVAGLPIPGQA